MANFIFLFFGTKQGYSKPKIKFFIQLKTLGSRKQFRKSSLLGSKFGKLNWLQLKSELFEILGPILVVRPEISKSFAS